MVVEGGAEKATRHDDDAIKAFLGTDQYLQAYGAHTSDNNDA